MESKFHELPPLKRFRMMQKTAHPDDGFNSSSLPAKKRKESRKPPPATAAGTTYWLPAKKRVWALQPDLISDHPLTPFDLNIEYNPSLDEEQSKSQETENALDFNHSIQIAENVEKKRDEYEKETEKSDGCKNEAQECENDEEEQSKSQETENGLNFNHSIQIAENGEEKKDGYEKEIEARDGYEKEKEKREGCEIEAQDCENGEEEEDDDGILCAICHSTDGDPSDPIVFCDGCDLMVHTTCYGEPLIKGVPEGDWFCTQCLTSQSSQTKPFSCCLCPVTGGAMKPTTDGRWAHIVCAVLVPEVFFADPEGREGIDCSKVPPRRWEQRCFVCDSVSGCAIDCSEPKCDLAFHITCGLKEELCIEYREGRNKGAVVASFCKDHTELWKKQELTGKFKIVARDQHKK